MKTERFEKKWFKTEPEANEFAKLVEGTIYNADFFGGYIVQYPSDKMLTRYVFEEYRDKKGVGSDKIFVSPEDAIIFAKKSWNVLTKSDQESYCNDPSGRFHAYEIKITGRDLGKHLEGSSDINLSERTSIDLWNYTKTEYIIPVSIEGILEITVDADNYEKAKEEAIRRALNSDLNNMDSVDACCISYY